MESKTIKRLRPFTLADAQEVTHLFNIVHGNFRE